MYNTSLHYDGLRTDYRPAHAWTRAGVNAAKADTDRLFRRWQSSYPQANDPSHQTMPEYIPRFIPHEWISKYPPVATANPPPISSSQGERGMTTLQQVCILLSMLAIFVVGLLLTSQDGLWFNILLIFGVLLAELILGDCLLRLERTVQEEVLPAIRGGATGAVPVVHVVPEPRNWVPRSPGGTLRW
ncbi:hypothetical protein B0O99DRAFT_673480 [Bisporella sp. PMI_857]|nr:hypothetical protein B0O99DRAFT_673480 [Bisporella sp. PMI_857]